jgi:hypothetical protein
MILRAHIESNSLKMYQNKKNYCEQKLQRKLKHVLHVQRTFSLSRLVVDVIKQSVILKSRVNNRANAPELFALYVHFLTYLENRFSSI